MLKGIYFYLKMHFPLKILLKIIKYCFNLPRNSNDMNKLTLSLLLLLSTSVLFAQGSESDFFRNIGKMYVVVAIIVATFIGIVLFLIYVERKVSKLERELNDEQ